MTRRIRIIIIVLLSIGAVLTIGVAIIAFMPTSASSLNLSAKLSELAGVVEVRDPAQDKFNPVNDGFILKAIQQLQTKEESRVRLDLSTGSIVRLGQRTIFSLDTPVADSGGVLSRIELQAGRVWIILKGGSLDVSTPGGLASVRGSYMSVWVESPTNRITICCLEGYCRFENTAGAIDMTSGQKIVSSDPNIAPSIQGMDQTDFQTWLNNSPESFPIVTQIYPMMVTSTPSLTPDIMQMNINTSTWTPTPTSTPTLTSTPCLETQTPTLNFQLTPTQTYTPSATMYAGSTPDITASPTVTNTPTKTPTPTLPGSPCLGTDSPMLNFQSTPTLTYTPTATKTTTFVPVKTPTPTGQAPRTTTLPPQQTRTQPPPTQPPAPTVTLPPPTQPPAPTVTLPPPTQPPAPTMTLPPPTQPPPTQQPPTQPPPTQPPYP